MINTRYSHRDVQKILDLLRSAHTLKIRVRIMDLDGKHIDDASNQFAGGQVNYDAKAEITRSLDLTLFDPRRRLHLDLNSPASGGVYITHMISIMYCIMSPDRSKQYDIPVFTGPIVDISRDDMYINIKCMGKEQLALGGWLAKSFKEGVKRTFIIKTILRELVDERKLDIPDLDRISPQPVKIKRDSKPWVVAKKLANAIGWQLYYDGRGVARMRRKPVKRVYTFREGVTTSTVGIEYDLEKVVNVVIVKGKKKKGKPRPKYKAVAPRSHQLSPWNLGRRLDPDDPTTTVPRRLWVEIQDDGLRTKAECKATAQRELKAGLLAGVEVKFDGLPNPLLEELDVCRVDVPQASAEFRLSTWTLPLVAGEDASYGYLKRPAVRKTKRRSNNGGKGGRGDKGGKK